MTINWLVVPVFQLGEAGVIGLLILTKRLYMSGVVQCGLRMVTQKDISSKKIGLHNNIIKQCAFVLLAEGISID